MVHHYDFQIGSVAAARATRSLIFGRTTDIISVRTLALGERLPVIIE